jgi:hypothetical protein
VRPSLHIRSGLRRALRRRYGFAALRTLRGALRRAIARHEALTLGPRPYVGSGELEAIRVAYVRALARLRRRWPNLDLSDERSEP